MGRLTDLTDRLYGKVINAGDRSNNRNHVYRENGNFQAKDAYFECQNCGREVHVKQGLPYRLFIQLHKIDDKPSECSATSDKQEFLRLADKCKPEG